MMILRIAFLIVVSSTVAFAQDTLSPAALRIRDHVKFLASPECSGRAPATDGIERAAAYIEDQFKKLGVKPAGANGQYRDPFSLTTGVKLGDPNNVMFEMLIEKPGVPLAMTKPIKVGWRLGVDYQPYGFSESGTASGRIVFAGYGIQSDGYNDYKGIDVKDAIVIVIRGLPRWAEKDTKLRGLSSLRTKATTARDLGAKVICFVNEEGDTSDVLSRFGPDRLGKHSGIIALQVRRTPCAKIFPPSATTLYVAEKAINEKRKPMSYVLPNSTVTINATLQITEGTSSNIIGVVPGTDPSLANEYLVIGAHYDHLGMGDENSLSNNPNAIIHPGADDNASGTSGVLELAQQFVANPASRPVLFMLYSGEEKGLLGSKHWVSTPTVPLTNIIAMINMDMIGRMKDNKLNVQGIGTSTTWPGLIDSAKSGMNLTISTTADGFGPSDHSSFTAKGIPVMFVFTGLHSDYHRPSDTWDKINCEGEATVLQFVERAARRIAGATDKMTFTPGAQNPSTKQMSSTGLRITLGVIPDYSDDPQGLRITGVRPGTPAEKAGLKGDDIITKIGDTTVKNIYDLMAALEKFEPGDTSTIVALRDGKEVSMKCTFVGK